jgi:hypothetical protein
MTYGGNASWMRQLPSGLQMAWRKLFAWGGQFYMLQVHTKIPSRISVASFSMGH